MNERIKLLRKTLSLTQDEFAEKLGLARNSIASYESGRRNPNDAIIKLICREFNVDYFWLTEGVGEMFMAFPETMLDELVDEYNLDDNDKVFLKAYLDTPENEKKAVMNFLLSIAENLQKKDEK